MTELLVAFAIIGVGGGILIGFLQRQNDFLENSVIQGDVRTRAQMALDVMANELRQTTRTAAGSPPNVSIATIAGNPTLTFYLPVDANADGRIIDGSGNIEWNTAQSILYEYNVALKQLRRIEGLSSRVIAHHVTGAAFEDATINGSLSADELRLQLTLQETTAHQRTPTATVTTVVMLRN